MALIKGATAAAAWAMNKAMMAAGIIGIVFMIIQAVASLINFFCFFSQVSGTNDLMKPSTKQEVKL